MLPTVSLFPNHQVLRVVLFGLVYIMCVHIGIPSSTCWNSSYKEISHPDSIIPQRVYNIIGIKAEDLHATTQIIRAAYHHALHTSIRRINHQTEAQGS